MRMSHEIFNMECPTGIRFTCILGTVSSIRLSPDRLKDIFKSRGRVASLQVLLVRAGVSGRPLYTCKKDSGVFPGSCIFINDYYIRITLACPLIK